MNQLGHARYVNALRSGRRLLKRSGAVCGLMIINEGKAEEELLSFLMRGKKDPTVEDDRCSHCPPVVVKLLLMCVKAVDIEYTSANLFLCG